MIRRLAAGAILTFSIAASAGGDITIQKTIPYADGVGNDAIRTGCDWNTALSSYIVTYAKGSVVVSDQDLSQVSGTVLTMNTVSVHSVGGGGFSGPKWANIHGELSENGQVIGSFIAVRQTGSGGLTACGALKHVAKAIGKDIARWLKAPSMDARLGDAH